MLFQFPKLLSPNYTSRTDPQEPHECCPLCPFCHVQMGNHGPHSTWTIISQDSQAEISFLFFIPSQKISMVFLFFTCYELQSCVFMYQVNLPPSDLAFGTKHLFPLLHSDRTSQPLSLRDIQFLELNLESPCPVSHDMDCKDLKSQKPLKIATSQRQTLCKAPYIHVTEFSQTEINC